MSQLDEYLIKNRQRFEDELCELLRIPSVSTDSAYDTSVREAGAWVERKLASLGFDAELIETEGHPLIYAQSPPVPGRPVVLVYGHYDVQPASKGDGWTGEPFEPAIRDGNVVARGATDDKGQMLTHVFSAAAWMESTGKLPLQLKFLIEGEEEIGSQALTKFVAENPDKLSCDVIVISDTSQFCPGQPAITYGLRGIASYELKVDGPKNDLHSGSFGGAVTNPINALTQMLAGLIDNRGKVEIPGFYDDVKPLTDRERSQFAGLPFEERAFKDQVGVEGLSGEDGYTTLERRWARPTYDIHGIWGGYTGAGGKTVLPHTASAKFSFRLVPDQDAAKITAGLLQRLEELRPDGVKFELTEHHGAPGFVIDLDNPFITAAAQAIERGFGRSPVFIREGGSIPIVTDFQKQLGASVLLLGWGLPDDNAHGPDEKFCIADFHRGIKSSAHLWRELSRVDLEELAGAGA